MNHCRPAASAHIHPPSHSLLDSFTIPFSIFPSAPSALAVKYQQQSSQHQPLSAPAVKHPRQSSKTSAIHLRLWQSNPSNKSPFYSSVAMAHHHLTQAQTQRQLDQFLSALTHLETRLIALKQTLTQQTTGSTTIPARADQSAEQAARITTIPARADPLEEQAAALANRLTHLQVPPAPAPSPAPYPSVLLNRLAQLQAAGTRPSPYPVRQTCAICFEPIDPAHARALPCGHVFHAECIGRWSQVSNTCPMDRMVVEESSGEERSREEGQHPDLD